MDINAIENYLNELLKRINDKSQDHFDRVDANLEFRFICRFLKRFLPGYMTFQRFQEWIDKNHFAIEIEPIPQSEEKESTT